MKKAMLLLALCVAVAAIVPAVRVAQADSPDDGNAMVARPASALFDPLSTDADVVYLIANSSLVFGPDPKGRSEEVTFVGPVTVPKWPMKGYGRRVLPDGRQQIDMELTQSELTGESYVLGGPVMLGEHPDLRSLGTITERPRTGIALASNKTTSGDKAAASGSSATADGSASNSMTPTRDEDAEAEEVPADFVVERKVLITTAKGILYNETAVPVRGRIDAIPPVRFEGTPTGVNVFRGMELPVALLDKDGNVNGWFYSKAHMAYAVKPAAIERSFLKGSVSLRSGDKTEKVELSGPVEIHHLTAGNSRTDMEIIVLALRGRSELLGGDIMVSETFSDRDRFSRGVLDWRGKTSADSKLDLFLDIYTPSAKLSNREPVSLAGKLEDCKVNGHLEKGKLNLALMSGRGRFASNGTRVLYDEAEKAVVDVVNLELDLSERM